MQQQGGLPSELCCRFEIAKRPNCKIGPVLDVELAEDPVEVFLNGALCEVQFERDFFVQLGTRHEVSNLSFAERELTVNQRFPSPHSWFPAYRANTPGGCRKRVSTAITSFSCIGVAKIMGVQFFQILSPPLIFRVPFRTIICT